MNSGSTFSSEYEKSLYLTSMRPVLNKKALFTDSSKDYIVPLEPNPYGLVKLRFRTSKNNVDHVFLICNGERFLMDKFKTQDDFDYYEYEYQLDNEIISYYFEVQCGKQIVFYNRSGVCKEDQEWLHYTLRPGFID